MESIDVKNILRDKNLDEIGNLILEGYGELLLEAKSTDEHIQEFINHVPIYLKKIELIHTCCQAGAVEELQKYLDRRKLAIVRENKSSLFLTPLHMAVTYNHETVARYLVAKFPETLNVVDQVGRTPLHLAAIHPNGKHMYNVLLSLGADNLIKDKSNYTAEYYYEHRSDDRYNQLISKVSNQNGADKKTPHELLIKYTEPLLEITEFNRVESDYISTVLGEALRMGLLAVAHTKPRYPAKFLADYLNNYHERFMDRERASTGEQIFSKPYDETSNDDTTSYTEWRQENKTPDQPTESRTETIQRIIPSNEQFDALKEEIISDDKSLLNYNLTPTEINLFQQLDRDKYGQTVIHYAATRTHSRNAFFQMMTEINGSVAYRDQLYRTARDIATFSEQYENVKAIDEYVLHIAANGETEKIMDLLMGGYDHILDMESDENSIDCATRRGHMKTVTLLKTVPLFEKTRDDFHNAIRNGTKLDVLQLLHNCGKDAHLLVTCRSYTYKCSLHIAVLKQKNDVVKYIIKKFPQTLQIGDNLERTALHYAMALDSVEQLSNLLIKAGASRTIKDLKGRQPAYYFINKEEILQMQQELTFIK